MTNQPIQPQEITSDEIKKLMPLIGLIRKWEKLVYFIKMALALANGVFPIIVVLGLFWLGISNASSGGWVIALLMLVPIIGLPYLMWREGKKRKY